MKVAFTAAILFVVFSATAPAQTVSQADLDRVQGTLVYRLEQARELTASGRLDQAATVYQDLRSLCQTSDPLAAEIWLEAADLEAARGSTRNAIDLYEDVLARFGDVDWASQAAKKRLTPLREEETRLASAQTEQVASRPANSGRPSQRAVSTIALNFRDAPLDSVQSTLKRSYNVSLDLDPALADCRLTVKTGQVSVREGLEKVAAGVGAVLEETASGYRLAAGTSAVKAVARAPKEDFRFDGDITREEIAKVVQANLKDVQVCCETGLNEADNGALELSWTIRPDGSVADGRFTASSNAPAARVRTEAASNCMRSAMLSWRFPSPHDGEAVDVRMPVQRPGSSPQQIAQTDSAFTAGADSAFTAGADRVLTSDVDLGSSGDNRNTASGVALASATAGTGRHKTERTGASGESVALDNIKQDLNERQYALAYEEAQQLRAASPDSEEVLRLLGRACYGLGMFDEAAASYNAAFQLRPTREAAWGLAKLLVARGNYEAARQLLEPLVEAGSKDWGFYKLLIEITPDPDEKLRLVRAYRTLDPSNASALELEQSLEGGNTGEPFGRMVAGAGEVVKVKITDYYDMLIEMNGVQVKATFSAGRSHILLSEPAANRLKVARNGIPGPLVLGVGGRGAAETEETTIDRVKIGNIELEQVPALIVPDFHTFHVLVYFGSEVLPDYSYRLDRRGGSLTLYPPGAALPKAPKSAWAQRYYEMNQLFLVDGLLRDRGSDNGLRVKMGFATELPYTYFHQPHVEMLGVGSLDTVDSRTDKAFVGYSQAVGVRFVELGVAGRIFTGGGGHRVDDSYIEPAKDYSEPFTLAHTLSQSGGAERHTAEGFSAVDLSSYGPFVPSVLMGWDVLRNFKITFDKESHQVIFESYQ